jgi:hypothetical protein
LLEKATDSTQPDGDRKQEYKETKESMQAKSTNSKTKTEPENHQTMITHLFFLLVFISYPSSHRFFTIETSPDMGSQNLALWCC